MPPSRQKQGLKTARTHCPITKDLIKIVQVGDLWIATTALWTSRPFKSKDRLVYELSYSDGIPPELPEPGVSVVRDHREPPGPREPVGPSI